MNRLEQQPGTVVYLDAGHSSWQPVGTMSKLLLDGGVARAQGFFLNVSNYQTDSDLVRYGTQVSKCVWYLRNTAAPNRVTVPTSGRRLRTPTRGTPRMCPPTPS